MIDVATFLGADPQSAKSEMLQVLQFEMTLANFSLPREERRNATKLYNKMRIKDLTDLDPNVPWLEYINNILSPEIIQVELDEVIIVDVPDYLKKFSGYLTGVPARVQSNYMLWRVAAASMKYLNEEARKISLKFTKKLTGKSEETPRWVAALQRWASSGLMLRVVLEIFSMGGQPFIICWGKIFLGGYFFLFMKF